MLTLLVTYRIRPGEEAAVRAALAEMTRLSRAEPGCLAYQELQSLEDPQKIVLFEQYVDETALTAHSTSEAFQHLVVGQIIPRLESRVRERFETIEPTAGGQAAQGRPAAPEDTAV
jgi:quinol monooxygenase YgiN